MTVVVGTILFVTTKYSETHPIVVSSVAGGNSILYILVVVHFLAWLASIIFLYHIRNRTVRTETG
jgi:hypothetical protein